jgi:hypothetical protein
MVTYSWLSGKLELFTIWNGKVTCAIDILAIVSKTTINADTFILAEIRGVLALFMGFGVLI